MDLNTGQPTLISDNFDTSGKDLWNNGEPSESDPKAQAFHCLFNGGMEDAYISTDTAAIEDSQLELVVHQTRRSEMIQSLNQSSSRGRGAAQLAQYLMACLLSTCTTTTDTIWKTSKSVMNQTTTDSNFTTSSATLGKEVYKNETGYSTNEPTLMTVSLTTKLIPTTQNRAQEFVIRKADGQPTLISDNFDTSGKDLSAPRVRGKCEKLKSAMRDLHQNLVPEGLKIQPTVNAAEEMENFYSRCLLCTCTPDVTPHLNIFSEAGSQLQLSEKINKYLNIQIKQEISDCLTKDLDFNQPAFEEGNYMDTTTNEMPVYNLDSTQSASEDFVQSDNDVVLPIEESTDITESTKNSAILKMLELKQCHFCQSEMYSQVLELHLMLCHQIYQEPAESDLNHTFECLVCQCQLPSELMQDHILQQHPPKPNPKLKNQIQCHYCHMQFSYCDMAQHLECHHGPNAWTECLHCKKMVRNTQIDLEIHLFQEHSGGQFLVCLACDLMFALTGEEQAHMQTHLNYKYKCPLQSCNKIFDTFTSIRHHVLILHPGFEQQMQDELKEQTYDILLIPVEVLAEC
ncbi:hypothetical protein B566_EDAN017092 [Ephemera danica]|nr:hypothetical protein B566_EDAN017092 [Ephemera danica]